MGTKKGYFMSIEKRDLCFYNLIIPVKFTQAKHFKKGKRDREVRLIVLHSSENNEGLNVAENLAAWDAGDKAPIASWHFAVDADSITQSVEIHDIAYHCGVVNDYSIGIEQVGKASQSVEQWNDEFSLSVIDKTAQLIAVVAGMYDIPIEYVHKKLKDARGITMHSDVSREWKVKGGHTDPGPNYPIDFVLQRARDYQLRAIEEAGGR